MNDDNIYSLKITLVGESTVGKSSIIYQFINKTFLENSFATIGCDKFSKIIKIKNNKILLNLWDSAGQERFKSLSPMFLKGSNIVILVYDITNAESFEKLENYWINVVKDNTENIILGIAGNKIDLYEKEKVNEEIGRKFAEKENGFFFNVSAKNYQSIEILIIQLATLYYDKYGFENDLKEYSFLTYDLISQDNNSFHNQSKFKNKKSCCN